MSLTILTGDVVLTTVLFEAPSSALGLLAVAGWRPIHSVYLGASRRSGYASWILSPRLRRSPVLEIRRSSIAVREFGQESAYSCSKLGD